MNTVSNLTRDGDAMRHRVLLIDDDENFTHTLRRSLERTGRYEVREVNNSLTALAVARRFRPHLVLLDVVMPGLDGGDVAAQFAGDPRLRRIPIIMLTGLIDTGETDGDAIVRLGSMKVLRKPVDMELLSKCMSNIIHVKDPVGLRPKALSAGAV